MASPPNFQGPIPGQSLTDNPGNAPWEHPPKYTDPHEALQFLFNSLMDPDKATKMLLLLEAGAPLDWMVHTFLFAGFTQGMWSPDMMVVMAKPLAMMITGIAKRANVKVVVSSKKGVDPELVRLSELAQKNKKKDIPLPPPPPNIPNNISNSLVAKRGM